LKSSRTSIKRKLNTSLDGEKKPSETRAFLCPLKVKFGRQIPGKIELISVFPSAL
jgi:hypothetical protein